MQDIWIPFSLSLGLVSLFSYLQDNIDLNLADEGYLWYGAGRTAQGDTPIIDFRSYDPGRYYWSAAWMRLFGSGIIGLRRSIAALQVLGLWLGLLAASRVVSRWWMLLAVAVILLWWMHPRHKRFEHVTSLAAVFMAVVLLENPAPHTYFLAGVFVGLSGFIGRNHGLYNFAAFLVIILFVWIRIEGQAQLSYGGLWLSGILVGYAPMLVMWVKNPGILGVYWREKIIVFARRSTAYLAIPVPWPWRVRLTGLHPSAALSRFLVSLFFLALPLFYLGAWIWMWVLPAPSDWTLLIASSIIGVPYLHHALSRADLSHLSQSTQPFLLGVIALMLGSLPEPWAIGGVALLAVSSIFCVHPLVPLVGLLKNRNAYVSYDLRGERLWLRKHLAHLLDTIRTFAEEHLSGDDEIFIAPHSPGLYPAVGKHAPVHNTYLLFPESEEKQQRMIRDLSTKSVRWALLSNATVDGREELLFRNTHPLVWDYVAKEFESFVVPGLPKEYHVFRRSSQP